MIENKFPIFPTHIAQIHTDTFQENSKTTTTTTKNKFVILFFCWHDEMPNDISYMSNFLCMNVSNIGSALMLVVAKRVMLYKIGHITEMKKKAITENKSDEKFEEMKEKTHLHHNISWAEKQSLVVFVAVVDVVVVIASKSSQKVCLCSDQISKQI